MKENWPKYKSLRRFAIVAVAFGRDVDGDGALVEDEAAMRLGWNAGNLGVLA